MNYVKVTRAENHGGGSEAIGRTSDGFVASLMSHQRPEIDAIIERLNAGGATDDDAVYFYDNVLGSWDEVWTFPSADEPEVIDWEAKYLSMAARVGREANERNWCGEYDAIAAEEGWPARPPRMLSSYVTIGFGLPIKYEDVSTPDDTFNELGASARRDLFREHVRESAANAAAWHGQPDVHPDVLDRLVALLAQRTVPYVHTES